MKSSIYLVLLAFVFIGATSARAQVITDFGTGGLNPVNATDNTAVNPNGDFFTPWTAALSSQNGSSLTFNAEPVFGGGELFTNLTTNVTLADTNLSTLKLNLTGENTLGTNNSADTLEVTLYETNGNFQAFDFTLGSFGGLDVTSTEAGVYNAGASSGGISSPVDAFTITSDGGLTDTVGFQFDSLSAVPEPSTYAMLGFGLVALLFWSRRNKRA